jgi:hypothetical protein
MQLVVVLILVHALAGCDNSNEPSTFAPAMAGPSWTIAYSPSMPPELSRQGAAYYFDFPTSKDGIDYVIERAPAILPGQTITMVFSLVGTGVLVPSEVP